MDKQGQDLLLDFRCNRHHRRRWLLAGGLLLFTTAVAAWALLLYSLF